MYFVQFYYSLHIFIIYVFFLNNYNIKLKEYLRNIFIPTFFYF